MIPADNRDTPAAVQRVPDGGGQFLAIRFDFLDAFRTGVERGPAHDVGPDDFEAAVAQLAAKAECSQRVRAYATTRIDGADPRSRANNA
jgi:hypothetical protein